MDMHGDVDEHLQAHREWMYSRSECKQPTLASWQPLRSDLFSAKGF